MKERGTRLPTLHGYCIAPVFYCSVYFSDDNVLESKASTLDNIKMLKASYLLA
ncbi:MAG: hypothetical protein ABFS56_35275 [Pseudomonadota bacterium]